MKLTITITEEGKDEIAGDLKFEGEGSEYAKSSLVLVAADLLQLEWDASGLEEHYPFREAIVDAREARK